MNLYKILFALLLLVGSVKAVPTISIANAVAVNTIAVAQNSASDNALVTGTCTAGDTCQLWWDGAMGATGTTTVTTPYNTLPGSHITSVFVKDTTLSQISTNALVYRIVNFPGSAITATLTNPIATALNVNTPVLIGVEGFNALNYSNAEAVSMNNMFVTALNGTVLYQYNEGNQINESNPIINKATNDLVWVVDPSSTWLGASGTVKVKINFDVVANSVWDGNWLGASPFVVNSVLSPQDDNGKNVFSYYCSFGGFASNALPTCGGLAWSGSAGLTIIDGSNSISIFSQTFAKDNDIFSTSPRSANTVGNTIDFTMLTSTVTTAPNPIFGFFNVILQASVENHAYGGLRASGTNFQWIAGHGGAAVLTTLSKTTVLSPINVQTVSIGLQTAVLGNVFTTFNFINTNVIGTSSVNQLPLNLVVYTTNGPTLSNAVIVSVIKTRINPPAETMPTATFSATTVGCTFAASNSAINFGSVDLGATLATQNVITITDTGNVNSNILTSGTSWAYLSNSFGVQNTVWASTLNNAYGSSSVLTKTSTDSNVLVFAGTANNIYYGTGVPASQSLGTGTYAQTISIISSC